MKVRKLVVLFAVLVLASALLAACGGGGGGSTSATLTLTGSDDLKWTPNNITVKAGQQVTLNLVNNGKVEHNFKIPDLKIAHDLPAGKTVTVTFTAPAPGKYSFQCDTPGHKEAGMTGILTVQ